MSPTRLLLVPLICLYAAPVLSADLVPLEPLDPQQCGPSPEDEILTPSGGDDLEVEAEQVERQDDQLALSGNVRVQQGSWRADAETAHIDEANKRAAMSGDIRLQGPGVRIEAEAATLDYAQNHTEISDARFRTSDGKSGVAKKLTYTEKGALNAEDLRYSTCELDSPAWHVSASQVKIDPQAGQGEAHHAVMHIGKLPVMYLPWIGFPVGDERKSGWLVPEFGSSSDLGYSLETPYYFNLAPHYDAVLSARYMGRRGLQFRPQGRYRSHYGDGSARLEFVADQKTHEDRYLMHWRHRLTQDNWDFRTLYTNVSDREYLEDYESDTGGLSQTRLRQEAHLVWRSDDWRVAATLAGTDPLKDRIELWDRLPKIRAHGRLHWSALGLDITPGLSVDAFRGELSELPEHISHRTLPGTMTQEMRMPEEILRLAMNDDSFAVPAEGERYDAEIAFSRPFAGTGWQVTPRVHWRYTQYELDYADGLSGDRSPSRSLPTFSLDARMHLERRMSNGGLQTLEPRLFYLNRPYREQRDLPRFDTRRMQANFDTLFRHQEHTGLDRIDAADQLAVGVGTRILDPVTNYLKFQAQLARVWYFRAPGADTLEGDATQSAWAVQADWHPQPQWHISSSLRYDPDSDGSNNTLWASHQIGWKSSEDLRFFARYTSRAKEYEQASAHVLLPLGNHWLLATRYYYDLRESRGLEQMIALEYEGCCMTFGVGAWRVRRDSGTEDEDYDNRILVYVRFHGLAGFGENLPARLRRELDGDPAWEY